MELMGEERGCLERVKELYYLRANQTEKYWARDNAAALKIQSAWRMYVKRKEFLRKKAAATTIQTQFRAFSARRRFREMLKGDRNAKNIAYFSQQATLIQKVFRGYFVRKYIHDFYLRKAELQALKEKNQQFRDELEEYGKVQAVEAEEYQQELAKAEFGALAKNLHHLSSTKGIPGVYNSPFAVEKPTVFERSVEDHLKGAFRDSYKWRPPNRSQILKHTLKATK